VTVFTTPDGWRKASYSGRVGNCIELNWRRSTFSGAGNDCVELRCDRAAIRDSKNVTGPTLVLPNVPALVNFVRALPTT
jgi:hypothetical protein